TDVVDAAASCRDGFAAVDRDASGVRQFQGDVLDNMPKTGAFPQPLHEPASMAAAALVFLDARQRVISLSTNPGTSWLCLHARSSRSIVITRTGLWLKTFGPLIVFICSIFLDLTIRNDAPVASTSYATEPDTADRMECHCEWPSVRFGRFKPLLRSTHLLSSYPNEPSA